jgi:hypothetical protein
MLRADKQQIPILVFGSTWSGLEPTIYCAWDEHANHYTTNAVQMVIRKRKIYVNAQITDKCDIQLDKLIFLWVTGISWTIELFFFHKINIICIINLTWYKRLNFALMIMPWSNMSLIKTLKN